MSSPSSVSSTSPKKPGGVGALKSQKAHQSTLSKAQTFSQGRPPWYDNKGSIKVPLIIGVAGGSGGGKTTVCEAIVRRVGLSWVSLVHMDNFYKPLTPAQRQLAFESNYNFDHPDAFDISLMHQTILDLKAGKSVNIPLYDFNTHARVEGKSKKIYGADVIILEGIFVLYDEEVRKLLDIKLFVDTEDDIRLARRLRRDIIERGRDVIGVIKQYEKFVKPAFDDYILPTKSYADVIIPRGADNDVAIDLIAGHVKKRLIERGWTEKKFDDKKAPLPPNVIKFQETLQSKYIYTLLRDKSTSRDDFIFYSDRMTRLLVEEALNVLPVQEKNITTLTGAVYKGVEIHNQVVGVSIMRSGDSMTEPLQEVVKEIACGTILIQFDDQRVPRLYFYRLPEDINQCYVILLDPMLVTGSTLIMALRLLLDHGVQEDHIVFVTLMAAKPGLSSVCYAYPKIKIIAGAIDDNLDADGKISPGLGHFGDRYFGTDLDAADSLDSASMNSGDSASPSLRSTGGRARDDASSTGKSPKNVALFKSSQF